MGSSQSNQRLLWACLCSSVTSGLPSLHGHVTTATEKEGKDTNFEVKLLGQNI